MKLRDFYWKFILILNHFLIWLLHFNVIFINVGTLTITLSKIKISLRRHVIYEHHPNRRRKQRTSAGKKSFPILLILSFYYCKEIREDRWKSTKQKSFIFLWKRKSRCGGTGDVEILKSKMVSSEKFVEKSIFCCFSVGEFFLCCGFSAKFSLD